MISKTLSNGFEGSFAYSPDEISPGLLEVMSNDKKTAAFGLWKYIACVISLDLIP